MLYRERVKEGRKKELLIIYFLCVCHSARVMAGWHPSRSVRVAFNPFCSPGRAALCVWGNGSLKQYEIKHHCALGQRDFVALVCCEERGNEQLITYGRKKCAENIHTLFSTQAGGGTTNGFVTVLIGEALCVCHCAVISRRVPYHRQVLVSLRSAQVIRMLGLGSRKALALATNNTASQNFAVHQAWLYPSRL